MDPQPNPKPGDADRPLESPRTIESSELLRGDREILIRHAGETYRLRLTRNDKLILQK